ncbi:MAG: SpoIIIAC/SpoIIIAD family protein [Ruminococcus sp.]|nr:SpoIIIAC/SpoIIIAD family protein [Ruminococcus sp.]
MDIIMISGFCIISAVVCKILESTGREIKTVIILAAACVLLITTADALTDISAQIKNLFDQAELDEQYVKILFKGLGICYITKLTCDFCRDCGENALAGQAELAGKIALLVISLPLFSALIEIVKTLLI